MYQQKQTVMTTLDQAIENNSKFANKGFNQEGRIATIVKVFYTKRKFDFCLNFLTQEDLDNNLNIASDGISKMEIIKTI